MKLAWWSALAAPLCPPALGDILDLTLNGAYSQAVTSYYTKTAQNYGFQVDVPLLGVLFASSSYTLSETKTRYSDTYRALVLSRGATSLPAVLEEVENSAGTTADLALSAPLGFVRPTLFGGALWRQVCFEDAFEDYGCHQEAVTWNAGAALSVHVTSFLRLKVTYRASPSAMFSSDKTFDTSISSGLTWSL